LLIRLLTTATPFRLLLPVLGARATFALVGLLLSNAAFVAAAYCLFRLTACVLADTPLALLSSLLFCLTPASTFYSAIYSESLFALLSFAAMWRIISGRWVSASLLIALSAAARSNGVLHSGFFLFSLLQAVGPFLLRVLPQKLLHLLVHPFQKPTERQRDVGSLLESKRQLFRTSQVLPILFSTAICCLLSFSLFLSFQAFAVSQFCIPNSPTAATMPTNRAVPPWCLDWVPYVYGYVQRKYWDVGFLRYFQLKQLPNFLLAAPTLLLSLTALLSFALTRPLLFLSLGLLSSPPDHRRLLFLRPMPAGKGDGGADKGRGEGSGKGKGKDKGKGKEREKGKEKGKGERGGRREEGEQESAAVVEEAEEGEAEWGGVDPMCGCTGFYSAAALPFLLQLLFTTAVATLVMHVQVATRFLSSSPPLYWFLAHLLTTATTKQSQPGRLSLVKGSQRWGFFISRAWIGASLGYAMIGSLLFINFYPFT
ncbi:hypothetical protein CLOP_g19398, partial [Closterium sp. NIES-67]